MLNIKKVVLLLALLPLFIQAQQPSDKKSQEILKGVSQKYKALKSLTATFSLIIENTQDKSVQEQKGTLFLKGQKYKLQIAGQDIISDGKTRWTFLKDANEVQIDNQKTGEAGITPANIFTIYEKGWNSKFAGEQKVKGIAFQTIELVPVANNAKHIFKVKLTINKLERSISSAKIFEKNGSVQTITVEKFIPDAANDESIYVFNNEKYPGSEVIDLR